MSFLLFSTLFFCFLLLHLSEALHPAYVFKSTGVFNDTCTNISQTFFGDTSADNGDYSKSFTVNQHCFHGFWHRKDSESLGIQLSHSLQGITTAYITIRARIWFVCDAESPYRNKIAARLNDKVIGIFTRNSATNCNGKWNTSLRDSDENSWMASQIPCSKYTNWQNAMCYQDIALTDLIFESESSIRLEFRLVNTLTWNSSWAISHIRYEVNTAPMYTTNGYNASSITTQVMDLNSDTMLIDECDPSHLFGDNTQLGFNYTRILSDQYVDCLHGTFERFDSRFFGFYVTSSEFDSAYVNVSYRAWLLSGNDNNERIVVSVDDEQIEDIGRGISTSCGSFNTLDYIANSWMNQTCLFDRTRTVCFRDFVTRIGVITNNEYKRVEFKMRDAYSGGDECFGISQVVLSAIQITNAPTTSNPTVSVSPHPTANPIAFAPPTQNPVIVLGEGDDSDGDGGSDGNGSDDGSDDDGSDDGSDDGDEGSGSNGSDDSGNGGDNNNSGEKIQTQNQPSFNSLKRLLTGIAITLGVLIFCVILIIALFYRKLQSFINQVEMENGEQIVTVMENNERRKEGETEGEVQNQPKWKIQKKIKRSKLAVNAIPDTRMNLQFVNVVSASSTPRSVNTNDALFATDLNLIANNNNHNTTGEMKTKLELIERNKKDAQFGKMLKDAGMANDIFADDVLHEMDTSK